jgi:hypothetical protein
MESPLLIIALDIVCSATYCLELSNAIFKLLMQTFNQVKMLMFYDVQTTNLIFVGPKNEIYTKQS